MLLVLVPVVLCGVISRNGVFVPNCDADTSSEAGIGNSWIPGLLEPMWLSILWQIAKPVDPASSQLRGGPKESPATGIRVATQILLLSGVADETESCRIRFLGRLSKLSPMGLEDNSASFGTIIAMTGDWC